MVLCRIQLHIVTGTCGMVDKDHTLSTRVYLFHDNSRRQFDKPYRFLIGTRYDTCGRESDQLTRTYD